MSTSTGGTLGLKLAAEFPDLVDGLILYSPNIKINNSAAFLLPKPWGLQIGRKVTGGLHRVTNEDFESKECAYWNCKYRMEAVVYLQQLVEATMKKETYERVKTPVFLAYYYKDETHQDETVRVDAMLEMFEALGTLESESVKMAFPEAGNHVIGCELISKSYKEVSSETIKFATEVLKIAPAK
jgi:alpha-beta hydrolase superfamily lysophospholipase